MVKLLLRIPILLMVAASILLATPACTRDQDLGDRELAIFLAACPTGPFVCYNACFTDNDVDGSGVIDGSEYFTYDLCNQSCTGRCSLGFLFYYLTDE
jgi:hypothetical protein